MKTLITYSPLKLMALGLVLISCIATSCTSLQQTTVAATDDLYYTPSAEAATKTIASTNNKRSNDQLQSEDEQEYQDYQSYPDDRYLRLKVTNRNRWNSIDDFGYWNDPRFSMNMGLAYGGWGGGLGGWGGGFGGWGGGFGGWGGGFGGWGGGFGGWGGGFGGWGGGFGYGGWDPFWGGGFGGWDPFWGGGFGGWGGGWGGFGGWGGGWGGFGGWGGWNPYSYYYAGGYGMGYGGFGGGYLAGFETRRVHYQNPSATQNSAPGLAAYQRKSSAGNFNNTTNTINGNTRYTGNTNLNSNFGSLLKRVVTNNTNVNNANSWDRPSRSFNNNNNQFKPSSTNSSSNNNSNYSPSINTNTNTGGRSGGFNSAGSSSGGGRAPRGGN